MGSLGNKKTRAPGLILFLCISVFLGMAEPGMEREVPDPKNFTANDPYMGKTYEERPLVQEVPEILNVTDLLRSTTPIFWRHRTSVSQGADVGRLTDIKRTIETREQEIIHEIKQIPGILEIFDDNKDLEAQIQNFLALRRAEVRDIHTRVKKLKEELEREKSIKVTDISDVGAKIQGLYDEIDLHLEDPTSKYNDQYILDRKAKIRRLMRKKKVLKRDFERLEYPKMKSIQKKIEFLEERRKEIHEKSRDLSFKFVVRRLQMIEKNNNRINYLVSIHMDRARIRSVKAKMTVLEDLKNQLKKTSDKISEKGTKTLDLEADIRFEERYYDQVAKREMEMLEEIRRSREMVHGLRSKSSVDMKQESVSSGVEGPSGKAEKRAEKRMEKGDDSQGSSDHVYVIPMKAGLDLPRVVEIPEILKKKARESGTAAPSGIVYVMPMDQVGKGRPEYPGQPQANAAQGNLQAQIRESNEKNLGRILRLEERLLQMTELMQKQAKALEVLSETQVSSTPPAIDEKKEAQNPIESQQPVTTLPQSSKAVTPPKTEEPEPVKETPTESSTRDALIKNLREERKFRSH